MGEDKPFNISVLHAYVDQLELSGLAVDIAIRRFLAGFRLPGEAQKIDRMMEKFAERFCACNPGVFPSADTAFILSFSVIMLQTDAHSPSIKQEKKMTKANFIGNNRCVVVWRTRGKWLTAPFLSLLLPTPVLPTSRLPSLHPPGPPCRGIANGGDLPPEFLGAIYDAIVATPISLREGTFDGQRVAGWGWVCRTRAG